MSGTGDPDRRREPDTPPGEAARTGDRPAAPDATSAASAPPAAGTGAPTTPAAGTGISAVGSEATRPGSARGDTAVTGDAVESGGDAPRDTPARSESAISGDVDARADVSSRGGLSSASGGLSAAANPADAQSDSTVVAERVSGSVDPAIRAEIEFGSGADAQGTQPDTPRQRKPVVAVLLLAVAAGALWVSSRMTWVSIEVGSELGAPRDIDLDGGTWFGALTPLALALLATIAAVFATRGWPRRIVGVVVALLAAVAAVPGYALLSGEGQLAERAGRLAELRDWEHVVSTQTATAPAIVALVGAVAAFLAGVLLVRAPEDSGRLSGKYDNPGVRRSAAAAEVAQRRAAQEAQRRAGQAAEPRAGRPEPPSAGGKAQRRAESGSQPAPDEQLSGRVLWDALDAGDDPTDEAANTSAAHNDPDTGSAGRPPR
ncbi:TIGR02234 family membrane protein [Nocardia sp. CC227C]|uniref:TIGR02234 family membrane protein n=1 Tax=Nocardia sp. CC227C TaxID=3044562 RepID=UPI00278BB802|nr:TIGR02234 family membrane protein [Nocardia sp. CC227C]